MPSLPIVVLMTLVALIVVPIATFLVYVVIRYSPIVARIFEDKPMFLPLRVARTHDGEDVRFPTRKGLTLAGTYLKARTPKRSGVLVFCHEYLSNRWSVLPYLDHLRDHGFDLLTFDFRNHGESDHDPSYSPLQWVTQHEVDDLQAAIAYLKQRTDADPAGYGLFGVSRGAGTAICVGSFDRSAWGVVTDGAFPTRGTMVAYIHRWAEIYVANPHIWKVMPHAVFEFLGWAGRVRTQFRLRCRYLNVEKAVSRLAPRPWLSIHGEKDAYIGVAIAKKFFERAGEPKELWIVPQAKHNRSREKEPVAYAARLLLFFAKFAPRTPRRPDVQPSPTLVAAQADFLPNSVVLAPVSVPTEMEVSLPG